MPAARAGERTTGAPAVEAAQTFVDAVRDAAVDRAWRLADPAYRDRLVRRHMGAIVSILAGEDVRRRLADPDDRSPEATQLRELVHGAWLELLPPAGADWRWEAAGPPAGADWRWEAAGPAAGCELVVLRDGEAADRPVVAPCTVIPCLGFWMRPAGDRWLVAGVGEPPPRG